MATSASGVPRRSPNWAVLSGVLPIAPTAAADRCASQACRAARFTSRRRWSCRMPGSAASTRNSSRQSTKMPPTAGAASRVDPSAHRASSPIGEAAPGGRVQSGRPPPPPRRCWGGGRAPPSLRTWRSAAGRARGRGAAANPAPARATRPPHRRATTREARTRCRAARCDATPAPPTAPRQHTPSRGRGVTPLPGAQPPSRQPRRPLPSPRRQRRARIDGHTRGRPGTPLDTPRSPRPSPPQCTTGPWSSPRPMYCLPVSTWGCVDGAPPRCAGQPVAPRPTSSTRGRRPTRPRACKLERGAPLHRGDRKSVV